MRLTLVAACLWLSACAFAPLPPASLGLHKRKACQVDKRDHFEATVCVQRGTPQVLGDDGASPFITVEIATFHPSMANLRLWQLTVRRDGKVVRQGMMHPGKSYACGAEICVDGIEAAPGRQWEPGHYRVTLVWGPDTRNMATTRFVVGGLPSPVVAPAGGTPNLTKPL